MMIKEGSAKNETFMNLKAGVLALGRGHIRYIVKMHYSLINHLLYSQAYIRQTMYTMYRNDDQGRVFQN